MFNILCGMNDYGRWLNEIHNMIISGYKEGRLFSQDNCTKCKHNITGEHSANWKLIKVM